MRIFLLFCIGLLLSCLLPSQTWAATDLNTLSQNPTWRKLLGYHQNHHSEIINNDFFLAGASGRTQPQQELEATLTAFKAPITEADQHAQCLYPARFQWLNTQLDLAALGIQPLPCPDFQTQLQTADIQSISFIFVSGYFQNPASYFGHLLFKLNSRTHSQHPLLHKTVNFGAELPPQVNPLAYVFKGISGRYPSGFNDAYYYAFRQDFSEKEQRDLWEYPLQLTPQDRDLLIAHYWELSRAQYPYYFFSRNCAYRLGEWLQLVTDQNLVSGWHYWTSPQGLLTQLANTTAHGQPLLQPAIYTPSRQSRLYQQYASLNKQQKKIVKKIIQKPTDLNQPLFKSLDSNTQTPILDTLMDYYPARQAQANKKQLITLKHTQQTIWQKRLEQPVVAIKSPATSAIQPHLSHRSGYINLGYNHNNTLGDFTQFGLRAAYYDPLDAEQAQMPNTELTLADLKVDFNQDHRYLKEFTFFRIQNLSPSVTGLPGDHHASWYLGLATRQFNLNSTDQLATQIDMGYGYAVQGFNQRLVLGGFLGGGYWGRNVDSQNLYSSGRASLNLHLTTRLGLYAQAEYRHFKTLEKPFYNTQIRLKINRHLDVRAFYQQDQLTDEAGISLGHYW